MASILVAKVTSSAHPIGGNTHNSSMDFSITGVPKNAQSFTFKVTPGAGDYADKIRFNVWKDINNWPDSILWGSSKAEDELFNNCSVTNDIEDRGNLYIGDPAGATTDFSVEIYANFPG